MIIRPRSEMLAEKKPSKHLRPTDGRSDPHFRGGEPSGTFFRKLLRKLCSSWREEKVFPSLSLFSWNSHFLWAIVTHAWRRELAHTRWDQVDDGRRPSFSWHAAVFETLEKLLSYLRIPLVFTLVLAQCISNSKVTSISSVQAYRAVLIFNVELQFVCSDTTRGEPFSVSWREGIRSIWHE